MRNERGQAAAVLILVGLGLCLVLAGCAGYVGGEIGRNVDDPELWVLTTRWENVGSYRRALSSYDAKLRAWPVLVTAIEEPSAYESAEPGTTLNIGSPRSIG